MVHDVVELVLQDEGRLGDLIVLVPLVELLERLGECTIGPGDLIVEIMGHGPERFCLVRPVTVRLQIVVLEHLVVLSYPVLIHYIVLQLFAKNGFAVLL